MATARNASAQKKAAERAKLDTLRTVTITIQASEQNLQRLAAFLLFCEHLEPVVTTAPDAPMPWEDPVDPRFIPEESVSVDYEEVKRSITKLLGRYVEEHGTERAREVLKTFGAERLSAIPQDQLLDLNAAFEAALTGKTKKVKSNVSGSDDVAPG